MARQGYWNVLLLCASASSFSSQLKHNNVVKFSPMDSLVAPSSVVTPQQAEAQYDMPWTASIDESAQDLLYMPFWEWQMDFMQEHLTNLRVLPCTNGETDFGYNENTEKKARIVNLCFASDEYKKIRMTYYDAGDATQVFNAVWYPHDDKNLPVLGVDLLVFHRKKYLAIVDFQPLYENDDEHAEGYDSKALLEPIQSKYPSLQGQMSSRFYDETKFFSKNMLFARFEEGNVVDEELYPAFQDYVQEHVKLVQSTPSSDATASSQVAERYQAYDTYSAERDPATRFFAAMFGDEWAQDYVHDFLFDSAERREPEAAEVEQPVQKQHVPAKEVKPVMPPSSVQPKVAFVAR